MLDANDPNLLYILLAVVLGFLAGWLIWRATRRPPIQAERRDHLAEHQVPTQGTFARVSQGPIPPAQEPPAAAPRHDPVPSKEAAQVTAGDAEPGAPKGATQANVFDEDGTEQGPVVPGREGPEGNDIVAEAAAATADVVGQFLGVDAHGSMAGEDDLQAMKGVGPKLAAILRAEGLMRFEQIAALTPDDMHALDAKLGAFKGRLARDRVVEQAGYLAGGDREGYERAFGKL